MSSTPFLLILWFLLPVLGLPKFFMFLLGGGVGALFAMVQFKDRPLAEFIWLSIRFSRRPKIILYDREYRIRIHRQRFTDEGGATSE